VLRSLGAIPVLSRPADLRPPERVRARRANRVAADLVVAFALAGEEPPAVYSFATARSRSEAGAGLAAVIAEYLGLPAGGRASPILRETRMPAVLIETAPVDETVGKAVGQAVDAFFSATFPDQPSNRVR
jgi:N-acetylmuramoyl-L-alanine amidase